MNNIIKVIKLYAVASSNENKPNPIPLFQTKYKLKVLLAQKIEKEIEVMTEKAEGTKCSLCWKIKSKKCERINCQIS